MTAEPSDELQDVLEFTENHRIAWPVGYGAERTLDALQVSGLPTTFVVGRDGKIVWNDYMSESFESAVEQALNSPTAG